MTVSFIPGKTVEVPEITYQPEITLPADATALIVMDMQNDFARPGGALTNAAAETMVPRLAQLLERARAQNVRVAYTQDSHMEGDPEWMPDTSTRAHMHPLRAVEFDKERNIIRFLSPEVFTQ